MLEWTAKGILQYHGLVQGSIRSMPDGLFAGFFFSPDEIRLAKKNLLEEVDRETSFKLLTMLESILKFQLHQAIWSPQKTSSIAAKLRGMFAATWKSAKVRKIPKGAAERLIGPEDILIELRDHFRIPQPETARTCSHLKGMFSVFRNWYAHGRSGGIDPACPDPVELANSVVSLQSQLSTK